MQTKHYIVVMRDNDIWLVGPFDTQAATSDYGATADEQEWHDPRWQTIELADTFALRVEPPTLAVAPGAYRKACGLTVVAA